MTFTFMFLAGVVEMWGKSDLLPPFVLEIIAGGFLVAFLGTMLIGFGLAWPSFRHAYAPIGLTLFAAAVLGRLLPGSAFSLLTVTEGGGRSLAGLITTGLFVHFFFYGRWSDRLLKARRSRTTTRVVTRLEADTVWHGLVPTPGRREALHDPDVVSVDWLDRDHKRVRIIRWAPPEPKVEEHYLIEDMLPGAYVIYRYVRAGAKPETLIKGLRAVKLIDLVDRRVVYVTEFRQDQSLRRVLFDWLDDKLGRIEDERMQQLEHAVSASKSRHGKRESNVIGGVLRPRGRGLPSVTSAAPISLAAHRRAERAKSSLYAARDLLAAGE